MDNPRFRIPDFDPGRLGVQIAAGSLPRDLVSRAAEVSALRPEGDEAPALALAMDLGRIDPWPYESEPAAGLRAEQERIRGEHWDAKVPTVYRDPTLAKMRDSTTPAAVLDDLDRWSAAAANPNEHAGNLVLLGPVGTGKTHAAWAALRTPYMRGRSVISYHVIDLLDALRPSGRERTGGQIVTFADLRTTDLLMIDDIGAERETSWTAESMVRLINARHEWERPIVVTSNLDPAGMTDCLGEPAYSRLIGGDATVLHLGGGDRRRVLP